MTYSVDPATAHPAYSDATGNLIDITVTLDSVGQTVRYTCSQTDSVLMSQELFQRCKAGEFGAITAFVHDTTAEMAILRGHRDQLLSDCDWTQLPDAGLTQPEKDAWTQYRQALRDLPANTTNSDPALVVWPTPP